eukprot:1535315-Amphidinium_carterae.1
MHRQAAQLLEDLEQPCLTQVAAQTTNQGLAQVASRNLVPKSKDKRYLCDKVRACSDTLERFVQ